MNTCKHCGQPLKRDDKFCPNCGLEVDQEFQAYQEFIKHPINSTSKEIRKRAWESLKVPYFYLLLVLLIYGFVLGIPVVGFVLLGVVSVGVMGYVLSSIRNNKTPEFETILDGKDQFERNLIYGLIQTLFIFLWSLLFIIPGIIKAYSYAMTHFIAKDNPELTAKEVLDTSERLMKGNKWRLFVLKFSFIGWNLLAILTFGIGFIFLQPYKVAAKAHFYEELIGNYHKETLE